MEKNIAVSVRNVNKAFIIPHERVSSLRGVAVNIFKKRGYEKFRALDDVSFDVKKGEFFGIIGRNGSGKSTLLKILAGIYNCDKGKVRISGRISPFLELGIGFNPELSGRDNVYLNATVLGLTKKEIDEKFDSIVKFSELERFIDQKLKNYSSGMQVRLAFSVSIHANREILLMDEVLAVGDSNFASKCLEEFNRYKQMGKTVVLVTHDISLAQQYCDRLMLIRNGKIVAIGMPEEVVKIYANQNVNDAEQRIFPKNEKIDEQVNNNQKPVIIRDVKFLTIDEKEKNIFETGEDIIVRIFYAATDYIKKPVFGLAIHSKENIQISGPNTKEEKFEIDSIHGEGYIDLKIKNNPFFSGRYEVSAAIFNWECLIPFDFRSRAFSFVVKSKEHNQTGIIKLDRVWIKSK